MSTIEQIGQMQAQGMNQDQIVSQLRSKGVPEQDIVNAMSQSQIKNAVSNDGGVPNFGPPGQGGSQEFVGQEPFLGIPSGGASIPANQFPGGSQAPMAVQDQMGDPYGNAPSQGQDPYGGGMQEGSAASGEYSGMQPSLMSQQGPSNSAGGEYSAAPQNDPGMGQDYVGGEYGGGGAVSAEEGFGGGAYPAYQPYQESMSSDMITEISEQIVDEKLSVLQDRLENVLDMRTIIEANMVSLNDRLKRMEKIIDQMQVSILKKVGEYLTDVQDVKNELHETQKSFVAVHKKTKHK